MHFLKPTLMTLATLLSLPSIIHAADCTTYDGNMQWFLSSYESQIWGLRQSACGDGACGSNQICTLTAYNRYGSIKLYRKDVQYDFTHCWDATANIITQCERNWWKIGWWQLGDEFYQINTSINDGLKRDEDTAIDGEEWTFEVEAHNITET